MSWREDRYTSTEADAARFEQMRTPDTIADRFPDYTEPDQPETPAGRRGTPIADDDLIAKIGRQIEAERAAVREGARKHVMDTVAERLPG